MSDLTRRNLLKSAVAASATAGLGSIVGSTSALAQTTGGNCSNQTGFIKVPTDGSDVRALGLQRGFNRRWYAHDCLFIYLCYDEAGVVGALQDVISLGYQFSIKGGGHCYENFVCNDDVKAIIDISPINDIQLDATTGAVTMGAGGTNWEAYKWLSKQGLCLPAGSCYSVGLGGHICGGGYGLLSRLHGLTVDWLSAVTVVTVGADDTPTVRTVSANSSDPNEQDLFWAHTGGGGGNFGVITSYEFSNLPAMPELARIYVYTYNWSDFTLATFKQFLLAYYHLASTNPREYFGLLKLNHISAGGQFSLVAQYVTSSDYPTANDLQVIVNNMNNQLSQIATPVTRTTPIIGHPGWLGEPGTAGSDFHSVYTFYEAMQYLNGSGANQRGKYKSAYMRKTFPDTQAEKIYNWLHDTTSLPESLTSQTLVQVDTYGGAINDKAPTDTAVPQRDSVMKLQYQAYWAQDESKPGDPDSGDGLALVNWMNAAYADIYSETGGFPDPALDTTNTVDGCYYNYPDSELTTQQNIDYAMRLYFLDNYKSNPRNLQNIKSVWDPENHFHHPQSIPLP